MADAYVRHLTGDDENSVAAQAITLEMSIKMMENSPLRSLRSFVDVTTEELKELIIK